MQNNHSQIINYTYKHNKTSLSSLVLCKNNVKYEYKIKLIYFSQNTYNFEFPNFKTVSLFNFKYGSDFCDSFSDISIVYNIFF